MCKPVNYSVFYKKSHVYSFTTTKLTLEQVIVLMKERYDVNNGMLSIRVGGKTVAFEVWRSEDHAPKRKILDNYTGEVYTSNTLCSKELGITLETIRKHLARQVKNPRFFYTN